MEMSITKVTLAQLHLDHEIWLNALSFYRDELKILDKYLLEIVKQNTGQEVMKEVEHFQNQFIRQKEVLDELTHDIREHERLVISQVKDLNPIQVEKSKFEDHLELREYFETFTRLYAELKAEFLLFMSHRL
jgi:hypothetical protein